MRRPLLVAVLLLPILPPQAPADSVAYASASLPVELGFAGGGAHGSRVYAFGGTLCVDYDPSCPDVEDYYKQIRWYDTSTGAVGTNPIEIPFGIAGAGVAYTGTHFWIFGGYRCVLSTHCSAFDLVYRFDPATGGLEWHPAATLPAPRDDLAAVHHQGKIYLFGGRTESLRSAEILRFDPATEEYDVMLATLPTRGTAVGRYGMSAVSDGAHIYLFGGNDGAAIDQILRYDPAADTIAVLGARLPAPGAWYTAAVWTGDHALVFGGRSVPSQRTDRILRYDPDADALVTVPARLPVPRDGIAAAWTGNAAWLLGGTRSTDILRYTQEPGAPRDVEAVIEPPQNRNVTIAWSPPDPLSHVKPLTDYRVWRQIGTTVTLRATVPASNLTWRDCCLPTGGASWYYAVQAVNADGAGPLSAWVLAVAADPPSAPVSLTASTGPGAGNVTLQWLPPFDDGGAAVRSYKVYRDGVHRATVAAPTQTWRDTGLGSGETHAYRVAAVNAAGEGAPSNAATGKAPTPPNAPQNLRAQPSNLGEITLTWAPATGGGIPVAGYRVYRAPWPGSAYELVAEVPASPQRYLDEVGTGGWNYRVSAVNGVGEGAWSGPATTAAVKVGNFKI